MKINSFIERFIDQPLVPTHLPTIFFEMLNDGKCFKENTTISKILLAKNGMQFYYGPFIPPTILFQDVKRLPIVSDLPDLKEF